jgi:hypothetical protein
VKSVPGVWGNTLAFLGGTRSCIGYRFSLYEYVFAVDSCKVSLFSSPLFSRTKIILHALISTFEFELAVPKEEMGLKSGIVTRPVVKSQMEKGTQLPLFVRMAPANTEEALM